MKITNIRPFVSTDRKVHVALTDGSSKDGYLAIVRVAKSGTHATVVTVKGDRGRPATIAPKNIDSITWHADPMVTPNATADSKPSKRVVKRPKADSPKAACGCTAKLLCKAHYDARIKAEGTPQGSTPAKVNWSNIDKCLTGMSAADLAQVIRLAANHLASRTK